MTEDKVSILWIGQFLKHHWKGVIAWVVVILTASILVPLFSVGYLLGVLIMVWAVATIQTDERLDKRP